MRLSGVDYEIVREEIVRWVDQWRAWMMEAGCGCSVAVEGMFGLAVWGGVEWKLITFL